ncbi:MAG: glycosyltransferase [Candidatus Baltobacteraceae bacterium]
MTPARRLVVVTSRYPFGSQEAYLNAELAELRAYFEKIVVVPVRPPPGPARQAVPPGVEVVAWPLCTPELIARAIRAFRARPREALRALGQTFGSRDPGRGKNALVVLKALALADWITENGFDHVHAYWISTPATVAMLAAAVSGVAWSSTAHRWDIYERNAFDLKERTVSFVRCISTRGSIDLRARMPKLNGRLLELRLGTVIPPPATPRRARGEEFHIACPAALVEVKGHDVLFAALARLIAWGVPVRSTLCGVGPLQKRLEETAARLQLGRVVEFAGFVPQQTLHAWYRAGRFAGVVLASRAEGERMMEGVPTALMEAMALGVPVVATDSGSISELLDERCGRLVKAGDSNALACALLELYLDPNAAQARADRAYQRVASQYDVATQMRKLATAFVRKD